MVDRYAIEELADQLYEAGPDDDFVLYWDPDNQEFIVSTERDDFDRTNQDPDDPEDLSGNLPVLLDFDLADHDIWGDGSRDSIAENLWELRTELEGCISDALR